MIGVPPVGENLKSWADTLVRYLGRAVVQLQFLVTGSSAAQDGILMFDPATGGVVVSIGGAWVPVGGSGGATITQTTLTVPASVSYAEVVFADAAVTATSKILVGFAATRDEENDIESIADDQMTLTGVAETGQVRFVITAIGAFVGPYRVNYQVAA